MTETDLLRLLRDPDVIPPGEQAFLAELSAAAVEMGLPCYVVGGFVRDLLLGLPVNDFDIVVEGDAIRFGRALVRSFGGSLTFHTAFRTAVWTLPPALGLRTPTLDLITARRETYSSPGALPSVLPSTLLDDLHRRDFTVNSMAIRLDGEHFGQLLDPLNGRADLAAGLIRVLHPLSFVEDPTRLFRAVRYQVRYSFHWEESTRGLFCSSAFDVLSRLSGERIRQELDLFFEEEKAVETLNQAAEMELLQAVHPELPGFNPAYSGLLDLERMLDIPFDRREAGYALWWMDLTEETLLSLAGRLKFSSHLTHSTRAGAKLKRSLPDLAGSPASVWTDALEKFPPLPIYLVYRVTREKALLDFLSIWRQVRPRTTGNDLRALGLEPGPRYGKILLQLRSAWLDGQVASGAEEDELLKKLLDE